MSGDTGARIGVIKTPNAGGRSCRANSGAFVCPMAKIEETEKEASPRTRKRVERRW